MGCHTWFYNCVSPKIKVVKVTYSFPMSYSGFLVRFAKSNDKIRNGILNILFNDKPFVIDSLFPKKYRKQVDIYRKSTKKEVKKYGYLYVGNNDQPNLRYLEIYPNRDKLSKLVKMFGKKEQMLEFQDVDIHDLFRTHGSVRYTDKKLYGLTETLDFIQEHQLEITLENMARLIGFWNEFSNGVIEFG